LLLRDSNSQKNFAGRRASKKKNCQKKKAEKEERKSLEDEAEGVVVGNTQRAIKQYYKENTGHVKEAAIILWEHFAKLCG